MGCFFLSCAGVRVWWSTTKKKDHDATDDVSPSLLFPPLQKEKEKNVLLDYDSSKKKVKKSQKKSKRDIKSPDSLVYQQSIETVLMGE